MAAPLSPTDPIHLPRLVTFGGLSVQNGVAINGVANPRSRLAILAVLATAGDRGIRREKLAAMFWPDSDEERARNALRQALFTLKKDLGAGEITIGVADLRLNSEVLSADVSEFDVAMRSGRFEDAAGLYRGSFLDGVYLRESPAFERWADEQRSRLSAEYGSALEKAAAAAAERGDARTAAGWWERRAAHDPLSGRVARLYMEVLAAAGDREKAIRHAAVHAQLVRQELEADPDPEVRLLADRLREAAEPSAAPNATIVPALSPAPMVVEEDASAVTDRPRSVPLSASRWMSTRQLVAAGIALAAIGGTLVAARAFATRSRPVQPGLVAIGFFENRTGDTTLTVLADMASTGIRQLLAQTSRVHVVDLRPSGGGARRGGAHPRPRRARARGGR